MSTEIFLRCLSHDPPIESGCVGTNVEDDLPRIRRDLAGRDKIVSWLEMQPGKEYTELYHPWANTTARFLYFHKKCEIGIKDEYGRTYLIDEEIKGPHGDWIKEEERYEDGCKADAKPHSGSGEAPPDLRPEVNGGTVAFNPATDGGYTCTNPNCPKQGMCAGACSTRNFSSHTHKKERANDGHPKTGG